MPGLIGQHLPTGFVPNPPLGSSTLLFDNTGVLSIKRNDGGVEPVIGSFSVSVDNYQFAFGQSGGLTSSPGFSFDSYGNLNFGGSYCNGSIIGTGPDNTLNSIIGAGSCIDKCTIGNTIIGGFSHSMQYGTFVSTIISGAYNSICQYGDGGASIIGSIGSQIQSSGFSSIISGQENRLYQSTKSLILGGCKNYISGSGYVSIISSMGSTMSNSNSSSIVGGRYNCLYSYASSILGGTNNIISYCSNRSSIIGGANNIIAGRKRKTSSAYSSIISGKCNFIYNSRYSSSIGGYCNSIQYTSNHSSIIGGKCNKICSGCSSYSSIIGGFSNQSYCSKHSVVIGGCQNIIGTQSDNSVILGGNNLTLSYQSNTALTQHLWIAGSVSPDNGLNFGQTDDVFVSGVGTFSFVNGVFTGLII